jgi:hypothetical protein
MPAEARAQLARRYLAVVQAIPRGPAVTVGVENLLAIESRTDEEASSWEFETSWWADEGEMALAGVNDGRQRFSGRKGEGLTMKQFELTAKGSLLDRFKKLQKDVGNPLEGVEFQGGIASFWESFSIILPSLLMRGSMRPTAERQTRWARSWCC